MGHPIGDENIEIKILPHINGLVPLFVCPVEVDVSHSFIFFQEIISAAFTCEMNLSVDDFLCE